MAKGDDHKIVPPVGVADLSLLTPEEIEAIEAQAVKEIMADAKKAAKQKLLEQKKDEHRRASGLKEPLVEVDVDLAPYADRILIDNVAYMQGQRYKVPLSRSRVMREIMSRTWLHQDEIDGKKRGFYNRARNTTLNGATGVVVNSPNQNAVTSSQILRA